MNLENIYSNLLSILGYAIMAVVPFFIAKSAIKNESKRVDWFYIMSIYIKCLLISLVATFCFSRNQGINSEKAIARFLVIFISASIGLWETIKKIKKEQDEEAKREIDEINKEYGNRD